MKRTGILHGQLSEIIATLGHGESIVVADYGLPIPKGVPIVDLAVSPNLPGVMNVLETIAQELVIERFVATTELRAQSPDVFDLLCKQLSLEGTTVSHEMFKAELSKDRAVVRTGEWTPFFNVRLIAGVPF